MSGPASDFKDRYGSWAVIAGGSDGIGASFAHQVAAEGINVVLLARRRDVLDECAGSVRRSHGVEVRTVSVDLTAADFVAEVRQPRQLTTKFDDFVGLEHFKFLWSSTR